MKTQFFGVFFSPEFWQVWLSWEVQVLLIEVVFKSICWGPLLTFLAIVNMLKIHEVKWFNYILWPIWTYWTCAVSIVQYVSKRRWEDKCSDLILYLRPLFYFVCLKFVHKWDVQIWEGINCDFMKYIYSFFFHLMLYFISIFMNGH